MGQSSPLTSRRLGLGLFPDLPGWRLSGWYSPSSHLQFADFADLVWAAIFVPCPSFQMPQWDDKENLLTPNPCLKTSTNLRIKFCILACPISSLALQLPQIPSPPTPRPSLIPKYLHFQHFVIFLLDSAPLYSCRPSSLAQDNSDGKLSVTTHNQVRSVSTFPPFHSKSYQCCNSLLTYFSLS